MEITPLKTAGCLRISLDKRTDQRGYFIKTFQGSFFREAGCEITGGEDFYTTSSKGVVRGMHFQLPPKALKKVVYCLAGSILDVLVDLRVGSPTYLQSESLTLSAQEPCVLCLPVGVAHGFLALADDSMVCYKVDQEYDPALDSGIRWDSFGYDWPVQNPVVSARDSSLPRLQEFQNPFIYNGRHDA